MANIKGNRPISSRRQKLIVQFVFVFFGIVLLFNFQNCGKSSDLKFSSIEPEKILPLDSIERPIDATCGFGTNEAIYPPSWENPQYTVPNQCASGLELNNLMGETVVLTSTGGIPTSAELPLEVDVATYLAPDQLTIIAKTVGFGDVVIFESCRLQSAPIVDPTGSIVRPPEYMIRYYRTKIPKGTTELFLNFTKAPTSFYLKLIGICGFSWTHKALRKCPTRELCAAAE